MLGATHPGAADRRAAPAAGPAETRAPLGPGGQRVAWLAILAAALIARVGFVATVPPVILWPDGAEYEAVARQLHGHGTYGLQALRPPGYPTLIAAVYAVFGENLVALRLVESVLGVVSVGLVGLVGARLFGRRAGLIAAALTALHPVLAFLPSTEYSESTVVLVILLALAVMFEAVRRGGLWRWAAAGLLLGASTLVRANAIALFPGLALGLGLALRRTRRGWAAPLLACSAGIALAISPWVIRDHHVLGRWFFISTGGGRQLWAGNNPATDTFMTGAPTPDPTRAALDRLPDEFARDRFLYREAVRFILAHPGRSAWHYLRELARLFALYPRTASRIYVTTWGCVAQAASSLLIFTGALVALRRWRAHPGLWPLALGSASFALANSVAESVMRYRMVIEPCLILMAGCGWAALLERRARPQNGLRGGAWSGPTRPMVTSATK